MVAHLCVKLAVPAWPEGIVARRFRPGVDDCAVDEADRGQSVSRLSVDAQNVTNAERVCEAAGTHGARRFDVMKKPLAP